MTTEQLLTLVEHLGIAGVMIWVYSELLVRFDKLLDAIILLAERMQKLEQSTSKTTSQPRHDTISDVSDPNP